MEKYITDILDTIEQSITDFQSNMPGLQKSVFEELQKLIKDLHTRGGSLLNNLDNLKSIGDIKNKLQKILLNDEYRSTVSGFMDSFGRISDLNIDYFKHFTKDYKPTKVLQYIREMAIDTTVNDLMGQGMSEAIIKPVEKILSENITTGGDYAKFQEQVRNSLLNDETGDGSLVKYTKQITTDAINQYNAQYHDAIAQDLSFSWMRYVGSNLTTSRQFCILMTAKDYVHISELPKCIHGVIDGIELKLSATTKLPIGMMPGTDVSNFKIRRGGYSCGHQAFWIPDAAVPELIRKRFAK